MFLEYNGRDLRLVKKAVSVADLKAECTEHLELTSRSSAKRTRTRAKELFEKLKTK